ncbi:MAG: RimK family protein [Phycisphaeraceae bacterium]|nr:RimK family protein [Phycisphaeraceae bacterium]
MPILLVVNQPSLWPVEIAGVRIVGARKYVTDPAFNAMKNTRVFNLCRSYSYQSLGYYVSLLAEARGHRPQPDVVTIQDMKSGGLTRAIADELDQLIQRTLRPIKSAQFGFDIFFGRTTTKRDRTLGARIFGLFNSPLLRVQFHWKNRRWQIQSVRPISAGDIPEHHQEDLHEAARAFFARRQWSGPASRPPRHNLAILVDPTEEQPPSDEGAIARFIRAANQAGMATERITRDDFGRLGEFDGLFIRATTFVNHYTYRFARRAAAERMAVIDDPVSIARCTNKVYLAERMAQHRVRIPLTMIVHRENFKRVPDELGLPCVLKQPDSAFSRGVVKVSTVEEYHHHVDKLLDNSELVIAQAYIPTDFDWRVGVLDGKPLYVCKYFMAHRHWQIQKRASTGRVLTGRFETLDIEDAPPAIVRTAVRAARLIGDGLYGVDLKQIGKTVHVIEVNDNPSIEAGIEDRKAKDSLYQRIVASFVERIERLKLSQPNGQLAGRRRRPTAAPIPPSELTTLIPDQSIEENGDAGDHGDGDSHQGRLR